MPQPYKVIGIQHTTDGTAILWLEAEQRRRLLKQVQFYNFVSCLIKGEVLEK